MKKVEDLRRSVMVNKWCLKVPAFPPLQIFSYNSQLLYQGVLVLERNPTLMEHWCSRCCAGAASVPQGMFVQVGGVSVDALLMLHPDGQPPAEARIALYG